MGKGTDVTVAAADCIASKEVIWIGRDEREILITARVGRPRPNPESRSGTEWRCPVAIEGAGESYVDICGEGSLHALALGLEFLYLRLSNLRVHGGRLLHPHTRDEYSEAELRSCFGR